MKQSLIISLLLTSFIVISCSNEKDPMKINISNLETACACADVVLLFGEKLAPLQSKLREGKPPTDEDKKTMKQYMYKMEQLADHCYKGMGYDFDEMEKCEGFSDAIKVLEEKGLDL